MAQRFGDIDEKLECLSHCVTLVKEELACDKVALHEQQQREEEALLLQLQRLRERHVEEMARLEAEVMPRIAAYEREALMLRASRNQLASACRLPPEILCNIFIELRQAWHLWTRVTHVCRRWRASALECGPLWASVSTRQSPREVAAFLERSGGASLRAHLDLWDRKLTAIQHINRSMDRIQSLDVDVAASFMQGAHSHLFASPAWGLETLFASTDSRLTHDNRVDFPVTMFAGDAPRLRRLSLRGCWFPPQWPPLAQLTELSIDGHHPLSLCDVHELAELLGRTPYLSILKLGSILHASRNTGNDEVLPKVALPQLTLLGVSETVRGFMEIWDLLSLPASTSLTVSVHRDDAEEYRDVIDAVAAHVRRRSATGDLIDRVSVFASTWNVIVIAEGHAALSASSGNAPPILRLNVSEEKDGAVVTRLVGAVFDALPLSRVRIARFDVDEIEWRFVSPVALSAALWADMLARTPMLEQLALRVVLLRDVLEALAPAPASEGGRAPRDRLVPRLRELQLHAVHFAAADRSPESSASDWLVSRGSAASGTSRRIANGEALHTWLARRHMNAESPLRLVLSKCRGLTPQLLDDLQQVVQTVEWNTTEQSLVSG